MFRASGLIRFVVPLGLIAALGAAPTAAADRAAGERQPYDVVPDSPDSVAVIESDAWSSPLTLRVITLDDEPVLSEIDLDPALPGRTATSIIHPETGERIHINIVEAGIASDASSARRRDRVQDSYVVNNELPFTREAEIAAVLNGDTVRRIGEASISTDGDPVGWITGEPVVEIFVRFVPGDGRTSRPHYGIRIVDPTDGDTTQGPIASGGGSEGGDPGGSPDPPECNDGGDPGGCPDPPGARGNDE